MDKFKDNDTWKKDVLFNLASLGDVALFDYWLSKKKLNIDIQDEDGDTALHYAAKRGNIDLITFLLKKGAIISLNKKRRTALLDAYTHNQTKIAKEITKFVIQRNTVRNIVQVQGLSKTDVQEQLKTNQLINDCIRDIKKNYLARNIFSRFMARHNERARALILALPRCRSIKEVNELINNQCNLLKGVPAKVLSNNLLSKRWSAEIKNKPKNIDKSCFYKTLNSLVVDRLSKDPVIKNYPKISAHR